MSDKKIALLFIIRFRTLKTYKKMSSQKTRKGASIKDVVTYTLPKLHSGKNWYVDFQCYDPIDGRMRRKKFMLDSITKISERKKRAAEIIANTTNRLRQGWNPWIEATTERLYAQFPEVTSHYIRYIEKLTASNTLKKKTSYDYQSRMNMLLEYNLSRPAFYHGIHILVFSLFHRTRITDIVT